jgi:hypothetical protein
MSWPYSHTKSTSLAPLVHTSGPVDLADSVAILTTAPNTERHVKDSSCTCPWSSSVLQLCSGFDHQFPTALWLFTLLRLFAILWSRLLALRLLVLRLLLLRLLLLARRLLSLRLLVLARQLLSLWLLVLARCPLALRLLPLALQLLSLRLLILDDRRLLNLWLLLLA